MSELYGIPITRTPANIIGRIGRNDPALTKIDVLTASRKFRQTESLALAEALKRNTHITKLNLWVLEDEAMAAGLPAVADALTQNRSIRQLYLQDCVHCSAGVISLAAALQKNRTLEELHLSRCLIGDVAAKAIGRMLRKNTALRTIDLGKCGVGSKGCVAIASALHKNRTLAVLHLSRCDVGDCGAAAIGTALKRNRGLKELYLTGCGIGDGGAAAVADGIRSNDRLAELWLYDNDIGPFGVSFLASALKYSNHTLRALCLNSARIHPEWKRIIDHCTRMNRIAGPMEAEARKVGWLGEPYLHDSITRTLLPRALERLGKIGSLSVMYGFVQEKYPMCVQNRWDRGDWEQESEQKRRRRMRP